jgi:hypothetical protein
MARAFSHICAGFFGGYVAQIHCGVTENGNHAVAGRDVALAGDGDTALCIGEGLPTAKINPESVQNFCRLFLRFLHN